MKGAHRYGLGLACGLFACLTSVASIAATGDAAGSDLGVALSQLAKAAKIELLFDRSIVIGKRAGAVRHTGTADETLAQLLAGSGLEFQRLPSGAYVVRRSTAVTPRSGDAPELVSTTPVMVPEVLVIGRRSINADLPRRPDDIQPYHVIGSGEIEREQPFSVDEIFADDLPANAQAGSLTQDPQGNQGTARSQIDIHGLGPDQTLVLVDGRRMPSNPSIDHFIQPDLNGLPVTAIDRVETLDATAGGIFGLGATGGVVNVVLKRDFSGVELSGGNGISAHGDGERWNLDGRVGFTSPDDQTHIMILGGLSEDEGITLGQRSFSETEIRLQQQLSPNADDPPVSSDINFSSLVPGTETAGGQILTLKPAYGGGSLNATTTYLPFNAPALTDGGLAILKANAGKYGTALSPDGQGVDQSLVTPTRSRAFVGSFWHDFGPRIDAFVDLLWLDDEGLAKEPVLDTSFAELSSIQPSDPFTEPVVVSFPTPGAVNEVHNETVTARATIGVVARLGGDWTLGLDGSLGQTKVEQNETLSFRPSATFDLVDGPAALEAQLAQLPTSPNVFMKSSDQLEDANLRLGGPLWALPGGPLSVTVTGEFRRETNPGAFGYAVEAPYQWEVVPGLVLNIPGEVIKQQQLGQKQQVGSAFAEIRAPLTSKDFSVWPFKSLELQLALRYDNYRTTEPAAAGAAVLQGPRLISNADAIISQTFGAKVTPASGWTLRASVANGYSPPTAEQLVPFDFSVLIVDPKRGGAAAGGYDVAATSTGQDAVVRDDNGTAGVARVSALGRLQPAAIDWRDHQLRSRRRSVFRRQRSSLSRPRRQGAFDAKGCGLRIHRRTDRQHRRKFARDGSFDRAVRRL
jgi:iron complex outermembrane receptor protein